jgi:5-methylcytosine-specific restriction endonuclease McrA
MLRETRTATITRRLTLFGWRYELTVGKRKCPSSWGTAKQAAMQSRQAYEPQQLVAWSGKTYWLFDGRIYADDNDLSSDDVRVLIKDRQLRQERQLQRARANVASDETGVPRRQPIPREIKLAVFERDGGQCVECGSSFEIQYDHIIPVAMGGASTAENLQILCATCNQRKGASLG